ncbi:MAG: iron-sulfur cluster repair di-iron protein [Gemmatimonadota bacterium]
MDGARSEYLTRTVGDLVTEDYRRAAAFTSHGIDFCCGGRRTLEDACVEAGVAASVVVDALEGLGRAVDSPAGARAWGLGELTRHIESVHHAYVRQTLPVLTQWTAKLERVHKMRHPELIEVRVLIEDLSVEMQEHMQNEESKLFPAIAALEADAPVGAPEIPADVLVALEDDHDSAGAIMRRVRELTNAYDPPADACATYRATLALLADFETDLHRHVHLENNILFPRVRDLQAGRVTATTNGGRSGVRRA